MRITKEKANHRREQLLAAGTALMQRHGYSGVGIKDITEACAMPKGSFYNFFDSKAAFTAEALAGYSQRAAAATEQALNRKDPKSAILSLYRERIRVEKRLLKKGIACLGNMLGQEVGADDSGIGQAAGSLIFQMKAILKNKLNQLPANSTVLLAGDAAATAEFIENSWRGAMLCARAENKTRPLNNFYRTLEKLFGPE